MGSATILVKPNNTTQILSTILSKPPPGTPSSTRPELCARYRGLLALPDTTIISVYTDSKYSIDMINQSLAHPHTTENSNNIKTMTFFKQFSLNFDASQTQSSLTKLLGIQIIS
jgi:ribonuclease HI